MRTSELLLSSLNITEDDYSYKGQFILTSPDKSRNVYMEEVEDDALLVGISDFFGLEEDLGCIRRVLMDMIMEKADISSMIVEGEVS